MVIKMFHLAGEQVRVYRFFFSLLCEKKDFHGALVVIGEKYYTIFFLEFIHLEYLQFSF